MQNESHACSSAWKDNVITGTDSDTAQNYECNLYRAFSGYWFVIICNFAIFRSVAVTIGDCK